MHNDLRTPRNAPRMPLSSTSPLIRGQSLCFRAPLTKVWLGSSLCEFIARKASTSLPSTAWLAVLALAMTYAFLRAWSCLVSGQFDGQNAPVASASVRRAGHSRSTSAPGSTRGRSGGMTVVSTGRCWSRESQADSLLRCVGQVARDRVLSFSLHPPRHYLPGRRCAPTLRGGGRAVRG